MARASEQVDRALLASMPLPAPGTSKNDRGDVLVVGGARKTPGAAALTGYGALRVGAGRLTLAVGASVAPALAVAFPEAGVLSLDETRSGSISGESVDVLEGESEAGCVVLGPGLDDPDLAATLLERVLPMFDEATPIVLDAYALGCLATHSSLRSAVRGPLLLTPNETEAAFLLDRDVDDLAADVAEIADRFDAVVTCRDFIAGPDGRLFTSSVGGPGLGTSGSGDVLSGALAGLVARGADPVEATIWATYLHGAAGDRLATRIGPLGFLARELADELTPTLASLG
jgi:hydroxyethylthiazole kinase-like uncharacterized protein yjeF